MQKLEELRKDTRNTVLIHVKEAVGYAASLSYWMPVPVEEAVRRKDGMVYRVRGKNQFRKFGELEDEEAEDEEAEDEEAEDGEAESDVASYLQRPLTRASIEPRRLFPPEPEIPDSDEEVLTDIEGDDHIFESRRGG
ncbi:hypothetical protein N0V85_000928 [Neurospora sp. IMI 360204]|nr:hypothetical protein N0V85_000928 [Neurospora sp. IMI 360204]